MKDENILTPETSPLISIVIPVFNGSDYLKEAIESALNQTYANIEIIVVNDGSNDQSSTRNIALYYGNKIRYYEKVNGGIASALNYGIKNMKGAYFSWLSHDDTYLQEKIEKQVSLINKLNNPFETILFSEYYYINEKSLYTGKSNIYPNINERFTITLLTSYPINGNTTLIPKLCFEKVGLFNESLKTSQDYDMWYRLNDSFTFKYMPDFLVNYRKHSNQGTKTIKSYKTESLSTTIKFLNRIEYNDQYKVRVNCRNIIEFYRKLLINYSFRGADNAGLPYKVIKSRYFASIRSECKLINFLEFLLITLLSSLLKTKIKVPLYNFTNKLLKLLKIDHKLFFK